jgi:hypothetical protein
MGDLNMMITNIESIWANLDALFAQLSESDWQKPHGNDWVLADLPYHLAYYDRDIVADSIQRGKDVPKAEQKVMRRVSELDAWHQTQFAQRPVNQTVAQSLAQMLESRQLIRGAVSDLTDENLQDPVHIYMLGSPGWTTVQFALTFGLLHPWNHFMEARIRFNPLLPAPDPTITNFALNVWMSFLSMVYDAQAGKGMTFTAHMLVKGDGGGDWGLIVEQGKMRLVAKRPTSAHISFIYENADAFAKQNFAIQEMEMLLSSNALQIENMNQISTFMRLFPPLSLETVVNY